MNVKDELIKLRERRFGDNDIYDLTKEKIYRIHFLKYFSNGCNSNDRNNMISRIDWILQPFSIPIEMKEEDVFKILSYLTDYAGINEESTNYSLKPIENLNFLIKTDMTGFKKIEIYPNENKIIDLFLVFGISKMFEQSEYYSKYIKWYIPNVTIEEVEKITNKKLDNTHNVKVLKK